MSDSTIAELREQRREYARLGPGERLALLVVDMQRNFVDIAGTVAIEPTNRMALLIARFRSAGVPVLFGVMVAERLDQMNLRWSTLGDMRPYVRGESTAAIDDRVAPLPGEPVIEKAHASCFFGTNLGERLVALGIDTLVIAGNTTSGCIRATAVDASARSLRTVVVEDAVFDHRVLSGEMALTDLAERYADVVMSAETLSWIAGLGRSRTPGVTG